MKMQVLDNQRIPTELTEKEFEAYVLPYIPKQISGHRQKDRWHS